MAEKKPPPGERRVEIDEEWLRTWCAFGFQAFEHLLSRHAAYVEWMRQHDRDGDE